MALGVESDGAPASGLPLPGSPLGAIPVNRVSASQLAALLRVSTALSSTLDLAQVLETSIESAVEVLGLATGAIYTTQSGNLYLGATTPRLPADFPAGLRLARLGDHPHIVRCLDCRDVVHVADSRVAEFTPAEKAAVESRGLVTVVYVPLLAKGAPVGVLILGSTDAPRSFSADDLDLSRTLAAIIAMAVVNSQLFERTVAAKADLDRSYDATIEGWSRALEMRDEGTAGHTQRVTDLTIRLALRMGIPEEAVPDIRRGALLHDIGKMAVPDAILQKPAKLDDDEWALMRSHPEHAKSFLESVTYLASALDIPYCHHERWDGSGYPQGLAGEEIPLTARVFAVIDVLDALTSDRPYRPAWTREAALEHIREQSGRHFDPAVVESFMDMVAEGSAARTS